jgi:predicted nucleic acid-binding protein
VTAKKVVVHTDVLIDFLTHAQREESLFRKVMSRYFCYTTVFQAIELFSLARTERQQKAVIETLSALKILGLNAKNAPKFGLLFSKNPETSRMNLLIAGLCMESKLPLFTAQPSRFSGVKGLQVLTPADLEK